jgi:hypothetical protein
MLAAFVTALTACASGGHSDVPPAPVSANLQLDPASLELGPGGTAQLEAVQAGSTVAVQWSVEEGPTGGTVTNAGFYTAPDTLGTYYVVATSQLNPSISATAAVTVAASAPPPPSTTPLKLGTGANYGPVYLTSVTGGGPMPSWTSNVVTAACAGDGVTDDTSCLQAAANAAHAQGKALVIPTTASFYRITGPVTISGSVGGIGGTPTIQQMNTSATWGVQRIFILAPGMTGWIYNLHLVGTFNGSNAVTEYGHLLDVGNVNGVTIQANLLENAMGDAVSTDNGQFDGGTLCQNVLVNANTIRNPYRCGLAFTFNQRNWVVINNIIDKQVNYVSGVDFEPEKTGTVLNVEVAYNHFIMNNRTVNPARSSDGEAVSEWQTPNTPNPGGNFFLDHNYGTFGTGFWGASGGFGAVTVVSNVEGSTVPQ